MSRRSRKRRRRRSSEDGPTTLDSPNSQAANQGGDEPPAPAPPTVPEGDALLVGRYIAENDTKAAVKKAKALHARVGTAESEALLVDAYVARIRAMESARMTVEAKALAELVEGRYACGSQKLREMREALSAGETPLHRLVGELASPELPAERRLHIEERIRREHTDLPRLAACEALPADHPIRRAAGAIWRAFTAVTTGPVADEQIALRQVPHRSPLADWKLLVRAIACFHRREDEACERLLAAMDGASAAARLVGPLRAMLEGHDSRRAGPRGAGLMEAVLGDDLAFRGALADLERLFEAEGRRKAMKAARRAVELCGKSHPELLDRLRQHISVCCFTMRLPVDLVRSAMGGPAVHDSHFWRLLAMAVEKHGDPPFACAIWEEFRRNAVHEGRFASDGPEVVAIYLHMVDLLRALPDQELLATQVELGARFAGFGDYYKDQPASVRAVAPAGRKKPDLYFLYPDRIFERVCQTAPDAEVFSRWLEYSDSDPTARSDPERVAEAWHRAVPDDSRPLLFLMERAEQRKAFTKALKYLEKAEALDGLSPQVKRARLRLWVSKAVRHLRDGKSHLVEKDFEAIRELPQSREGDRPAVLAAMGWAGAKLADDEPAAAARWAELAGLVGGEGPAVAMLACMGRFPAKVCPPPGGKAHLDGQAFVVAIGRACAACRDLGINPQLPAGWNAPLAEALASADTSHDPAHLRALAETAIDQGDPRVAYAAAGAGLRLGGPHRGRFLLLRGMCLYYNTVRRQECLNVAAELARRQRDTDLLAEVIDQSGSRWIPRDEAADLSVADDFVEAVLKRETASRDLADAVGPIPPSQRGPSPSARRRPSPEGPFQPSLFEGILDEEDEDEFDEADEDDWDDGPDPMPFDGPLPPPEVLNVLLEIMDKTDGRFPSDRELNRMLETDPHLRDLALEMLAKHGPPGMGGFGGFGGPTGPDRKEQRRRRKRDRRNRRR